MQLSIWTLGNPFLKCFDSSSYVGEGLGVAAESWSAKAILVGEMVWRHFRPTLAAVAPSCDHHSWPADCLCLSLSSSHDSGLEEHSRSGSAFLQQGAVAGPRAAAEGASFWCSSQRCHFHRTEEYSRAGLVED